MRERVCVCVCVRERECVCVRVSECTCIMYFDAGSRVMSCRCQKSLQTLEYR